MGQEATGRNDMKRFVAVFACLLFFSLIGSALVQGEFRDDLIGESRDCGMTFFMNFMLPGFYR